MDKFDISNSQQQESASSMTSIKHALEISATPFIKVKKKIISKLNMTI